MTTTTTQRSKVKGSGVRSKSQHVALMLDRTLNGSFSQSVLLLLFSLTISALLSTNDAIGWFRGLPVMDQFAWITAFAFFSLGFAVTIREFCVDSAVRWVARAIGIVGVSFLVMFSYSLTKEVESLKSKIAAKGGTHATGIADANPEFQDEHSRIASIITTRSGHTVSISGSMSEGTGRHRYSRERLGRLPESMEGTDGRSNRSLSVLPGGVSFADGSERKPVREF